MSKKIRVGLNGMGRIGRTLLRNWMERMNSPHNTIEFVGVNDLGTIDPYIHLLKHDSVHGPLKGTIKHEGNQILLNNQPIKFFSSKNPAEIPWNDLGVQIVIDATGVFKDKEGLSKHMAKGTVKKVIMCAPGKDLDGTFVMGINNTTYDSSKHHIISNASCTTNCLSPIAKVLEENFGIVSGFMTTVHSYTSDQSLLDNTHSDLRRARAANLSMIPTTTGAAKALGEVIPSLKGKLDGYAVRVPTPNVSMVDLTAVLKKSATKDEINSAMKKASESETLKGILDYTDEELVSTDFNGNKASSIFDSKLTNVIGNNVKVVSWYDNETGFSNRVLDLAAFIGQKL